MLVLSRRVGEAVVIDGNIRITLLETQGGRIRVGITAPDCVRVDRAEIHERRSQGEIAEWGAGLFHRERKRDLAPAGELLEAFS